MEKERELFKVVLTPCDNGSQDVDILVNGSINELAHVIKTMVLEKPAMMIPALMIGLQDAAKEGFGPKDEIESILSDLNIRRE